MRTEEQVIQELQRMREVINVIQSKTNWEPSQFEHGAEYMLTWVLGLEDTERRDRRTNFKTKQKKLEKTYEVKQ